MTGRTTTGHWCFACTLASISVDVERGVMVSLAQGRRAAGPVTALAAGLGRLAGQAYANRRNLLSILRTFVRFSLLLAGLILGVGAAWILAGRGWGILAAAVACWVLEWIIRDGGQTHEQRQ